MGDNPDIFSNTRALQLRDRGCKGKCADQTTILKKITEDDIQTNRLVRRIAYRTHRSEQEIAGMLKQIGVRLVATRIHKFDRDKRLSSLDKPTRVKPLAGQLNAKHDIEVKIPAGFRRQKFKRNEQYGESSQSGDYHYAESPGLSGREAGQGGVSVVNNISISAENTVSAISSQISGENTRLHVENARLQVENASLQVEKANLQAEVRSIQACMLRERIKDLQQRVSQAFEPPGKECPAKSELGRVAQKLESELESAKRREAGSEALFQMAVEGLQARIQQAQASEKSLRQQVEDRNRAISALRAENEALRAQLKAQTELRATQQQQMAEAFELRVQGARQSEAKRAEAVISQLEREALALKNTEQGSFFKVYHEQRKLIADFQAAVSHHATKESLQARVASEFEQRLLDYLFQQQIASQNSRETTPKRTTRSPRQPRSAQK